MAQRRFPAKMMECLQLWLRPALQAFSTTARQALDQGSLRAPRNSAERWLLATEMDSEGLETAMET